MNIRVISAENFKNLKLDKVPMQVRTLVMGENGVGKSNLLQLIHSAFIEKRALAEYGSSGNPAVPQFRLEGHLEHDDLIRFGKKVASAMFIVSDTSTLFNDVKKAFFTGTIPASKEPTIAFTFAPHSGGTDVRVKEIKLGSKVLYSTAAGAAAPTTEQTRILQRWVDTNLTNSTVYVAINRLTKRELVPLQPDVRTSAVDNLENTIMQLLTSPKEKEDTINRIKERLGGFFKVKDLRVKMEYRGPKGALPDNRSVDNLHLGVRLQEEGGQWVNLNQVGTGIQQLMVIVAMLERESARIALIEEFESSLSIRNRNRFVDEFMKNLVDNGILDQIIATTHTMFRTSSAERLTVGTVEPNERLQVGFKKWTGEDWRVHQKGVEKGN